MTITIHEYTIYYCIIFSLFCAMETLPRTDNDEGDKRPENRPSANAVDKYIQTACPVTEENRNSACELSERFPPTDLRDEVTQKVLAIARENYGDEGYEFCVRLIEHMRQNGIPRFNWEGLLWECRCYIYREEILQHLKGENIVCGAPLNVDEASNRIGVRIAA